MKTLIASLLIVSSASAVEMKISRDLPYAKPKSERQLLDVYAPPQGKGHPVLVWIHGGAWRFGNKRSVQQKPQALVDRGLVFVSVNYRFVPQATMPQIAADIAKAIRWTHDHASEYGGAKDKIFVAGHSAGAHLAALVATDSQYLEAEGLSLANLKGCIPVDTAMYDAARQIKERGPNRSRIYIAAFSSDEQLQRKYSPLPHVAKGKKIPPFLILHVASRPDSTAQSEAFAQALQDADIDAQLVAGQDKTHGTINSELGQADDQPTQALFKFLDRLTK